MNLFLGLLFGLTLAEAAAPEPLRFQLAGEPNTLDPYQVSDVLGFNLISNVAVGLVRLDGEGKLQHELSLSHKTSKDGKELRFVIRPDARWSDGKAVTADDFVFGIRRALDPATAARDASLLEAIQEVKNENGTLVLKLKHPDESLLQALTMPLAAAARPENFDGKNWKTDGPSAGPFRVSAYKPDREIRLEPLGNASPRPELIFQVIPEETTALNLFETGKLHLLTTIPPTEVSRLEKTGTLKKSPSAASFYLAFHLEKAPFQDVRWRKALAAAVDRESLARVQPGFFAPTTSYLPSSLRGSTPYRPGKSRTEIEWAKAQPKPDVSLVYAGSALSNLLLQRLQNDLKQKLQWDIRLEPMEWKAYLGRLQGGAPAFFYMGYSAPFDDPASHLKLFLGDEPDNRSRYRSKEYDAIVAKVRSSAGAARAKAAEQAASLLVERDVAVIPLLERQQLHGVAKEIKGFRVNPFGVMDLREIRR